MDIKDIKKEELEKAVANFTKPKTVMGRPRKRPPLEELAYLYDVKDLSCSELAKKYGVKPNTIRVWKHLARNGKY